ncbi:MAG: hypothetical protein IPN79_07135 [Saprospiraceae bacterium]|nr:hypothetical protein [Saprospiraceae bacterium]
MKSKLAGFLLITYLFSLTPVKELGKIPVLIFHYYAHVNENPEMTISEFFDIHYAHGIVFDEDYEQDMKLPFKLLDHNQLPVFIIHEDKECVQILSLYFDNKTHKPFENYRYIKSDAHLHGIFHPPKELNYLSA